MARLLVIVAIALGNIATCLGDDESFTLKQYLHKEGDRLKQTWQLTTEDSVSTKVGMRQSTEETATKEKGSYTEELIKTAPDTERVLRMRRTYHELSTTGVDGRKTDGFFVGQTIEVDFSKDKPKFTIDGKPPTDDQQIESEKLFVDNVEVKRARETMPEKPVKIGGTWDLDRKTALGEMKSMMPQGIVFDEKKSTFVGKLLKVNKNEGYVEGVVEFTFILPITKFPINDGMIVETAPGSTITFKEVITSRIDGSPGNSKNETTFKLNVNVKLPESFIEIKSLITGTELHEYLPKAKK